MTAIETKSAIEAAHKCGPIWKSYTPRERSNVLLKWHQLVIQNQKDLATLISLESGKPLAEAMKEIAYGASFIQWFSEEASRIDGDWSIPNKGRRVIVQKEPVGVCGIITPWNFPNAMITRKAGAALAAGCTLVCKPAPETPLSATALAYLASEAGIPNGVFNVITCSKTNTPLVGLELTSHPVVKKISFTGSTAVGKLLLQQGSSTMKRMSLELGGNAPFIVFQDADIDLAIKGVIGAKFRNAGQTCISANRIYVHSSIYKEFSNKLSHAVSKLRVGNGLDEDQVDVGPLISLQGVEKVHRHVQDIVQRGGQILTGGKRIGTKGNFYAPTVVIGVDSSSLVCQEETFGPLAALLSFETEEQVIDMANNTPFGLAGYFYSKDISRIFRVADSLQVGMVGVNESAISSDTTPFGGIKESGMGREGSKYGIQEYLNIKYICLGGIQESKL